MTKPDLLIIGGGAAGLTAALFAAREGLSVTLAEHTDRLGRKLSITGKGRCNLTNACEETDFFDKVIRGGKFIRSALAGFSQKDTVKLFEGLGLPCHTERGDRIFPDCEDAKLVVSALTNACQNAGVSFLMKIKPLQILQKEGRIFGLQTEKETILCDTILLATGGKSYPITGSDGSGYALAKACGHTVTPLHPALVPLKSSSADCKEMMGLSLKNVLLTVRQAEKKKPVYAGQGELLFTHFGISGPLVLSASSHLDPALPYSVFLDWKPALTEEMLDKRLLREIAAAPAKSCSNLLRSLLPTSAVPVFLRRTGWEGEKRCDQLQKKERAALIKELKQFDLSYDGMRPLEEGIVTAGGIKLSEVDPRTMASKCCDGLFFAGEILDVDALTGGFNLQIAFSTAFAAAKGIKAYCEQKNFT